MSTFSEAVTRQTEAVFARRMEVALRMFAGEASYDEVLAFHADDFIWMSPMGTIQGCDAARERSAQRMAKIPAEALQGVRYLQTQVFGEYAFLTFKTDLIPFGMDTFRFRDGKVVFQANAMYIPRSYRDTMRREGSQGQVAEQSRNPDHVG